jgi:hypothetical protein
MMARTKWTKIARGIQGHTRWYWICIDLPGRLLVVIICGINLEFKVKSGGQYIRYHKVSKACNLY